MSRTVTLSWDDDEGAEIFLRLHESRREWGYLTDSDGDLLQGVVAAAEITPGEGQP